MPATAVVVVVRNSRRSRVKSQTARLPAAASVFVLASGVMIGTKKEPFWLHGLRFGPHSVAVDECRGIGASGLSFEGVGV